MKQSNAERFAAHVTEWQGHTLWKGGSQFRISIDGGTRYRGTRPEQAAYCIAQGIDRLPAGMGVFRSCSVVHCVKHIEVRDARSRRGPSRARLSPKELEWVLSFPSLVARPGTPSMRRVTLDTIRAQLGNRLSRHTLSSMRTPSARAARALRAQALEVIANPTKEEAMITADAAAPAAPAAPAVPAPLPFHQALAAARLVARLGKVKLARKLRVSSWTVQMWEKGKFKPSEAKYRKLCKLFPALLGAEAPEDKESVHLSELAATETEPPSSTPAIAHVRCSGCGKIKERTAFNLGRSRPNGLQARCKECRKSRYGAKAVIAAKVSKATAPVAPMSEVLQEGADCFQKMGKKFEAAMTEAREANEAVARAEEALAEARTRAIESARNLAMVVEAMRRVL